MTKIITSDWPRLSPLKTGLRGRCPRCGKGRIFKGFLSLRDRCEVCGLSFDYADTADGPAFFVMMFACIPAAIFPVWLEFAFSPPWWVHLVTSLPLILANTLLPLRPIKGWLMASQYFFKAGEGKLSDRSEGEG